MFRIALQDLDLEQIAASGQVFRWQKIGPYHYSIIAFEKYLEVCQKRNVFSFSCSEEEFASVWYSYFDLGTDYAKIKALVSPEDAFLYQAVAYGHGIRILRQELWEVLISFLISQNNNIPRIKKSIQALSELYGKKYCTKEGIAYTAFARPQAILEGGTKGLSTVGLGYRDTYVWQAAANFEQKNEMGEEWRAVLEKAAYEKAYQMLLEQRGIGKKVADCICLFGLHHSNAFPVDTHIRQILQKQYEGGFPYERYAGFLGVIQQYLFYYAYMHKKKLEY